MDNTKPVALFLPTLKGGGAERMMIQLGAALVRRGHRVDLVIGRAKGPYLQQIPSSLRLVLLQSPKQSIRKQIPQDVPRLEITQQMMSGIISTLLRLNSQWQHLLPLLLSRYGRRILKMIPLLAEYIHTQRPTVLLSALLRANVVAVAANQLSSSPTKIFVSERNHLSSVVARSDNFFVKRGEMARHFYSMADGVIAVSQGVADDLAELTGLPVEKIVAIKNPVVTEELLEKAKHPIEHPWFKDENIPVVLAAGRLTDAKDYPTLLKAIDIIRRERPVRLLILGDGRLQSSLLSLVADLGLNENIEFHGFADNPYAYMSRASVFALSSAWEGSPNVLVEAMACGCPVVSTSCPSGPDEILDNRVYGELVEVGNSEALAYAIIKQLDTPTHRAVLHERASHYSSDSSAEHYERAIGMIKEI